METITIMICIKIFLISYTITRFEPLQWILDILPDNLFFNIIRLALSCSKCLSLYVGFIMTYDIYIAMIMSLFMVIFEKTFGHWENKVIF